MFRLSKEFFSGLTEEEKIECERVNNKGYDKSENLDPANLKGDWKEVFNVGVIEAGHTTQYLPPMLSKAVDVLASFQSRCFDLCQIILQALALSLELDIDLFSSQHLNDAVSNSILRLLHYFPQTPSPTATNRAGAHSDYGSLTILFVDQTNGEGLQILPGSQSIVSEEEWIDFPVVENGLVINIGDAIELWTGGMYKSSLHRVKPATKGSEERYSIAWFNHARDDALLTSVVTNYQVSSNDLVRMTRKGVKLGTDITAAEHLKARLTATYI